MMLFILGPAGMGKTEVQKIVRLLFGDESCVTPDLNVFGRTFSTSQINDGFAKMLLGDEIPPQGGLTPTQLQTWIDGTRLGAEVKHQQDLVHSHFNLFVMWCANEFFKKWDVTAPLLRRIISIDVGMFTYNKMDKPPVIKVKEGGEVPLFLTSYLFS